MVQYASLARVPRDTMPKEDRLSFGVHVPPEGKDFETMKEFCQTAESLGYDLFTVTDHFMNMANPTGRQNHPLECWTTLAALGAVTRKIAIGPLVSCVNYRHPAVLAKIATTVDIITGGRLVFGIGAGWHEMEFKGFMGRFPSAKERLDGLEDTVQICRSMFDNENTSFSGKLHSVKNTLNSPRPIQKSIPIMVGGSGEKRTLKIAAKYADISHLFANSPQQLDHKLQVLRKHCTNVKREFSQIKIAVGLRPLLDPSKEEIKTQTERISRTAGISLSEAEKTVYATAGAKNLLNVIKEYQRLGVNLITVSGIDLEEAKSFKDQIISKVG
jgi:F420-dependent oxidoreductase-like protein